ncbi:MAG: ATP-binding cassette domain-containing protein [Endomicrobium sp.]|nr:ATP-binding cassette domain-containing protein [Endomicrobium sp.]
MVIIGSSGTGKSILLKTIIGLIKPNTSSVKIDDVDITNCLFSDLHKTQKKWGMFFKKPRFLIHLLFLKM